MKGGLGSGKAGAGGMMSFVKKGGKNDRQVGVGGGNKLEEDLSLFRELKNRSNQHKHRNLLLLHPLSLFDEFDDDSLVPNGT
ncbi:hypothetical protein TIFTF001_016027 [Ficus carica]|uniref:Uncharacterized protein n=1 Tax=Ficus carica TaxID=3494 RepID=A0AA88A2C6_FICCA|nr:hypothetical protein TIFTF001_016027 [Ficus carica]